MKSLPYTVSRLTAFARLGIALAASPLHAQKTTQAIALGAGWNAVWLEVEPTYEIGDTAASGVSPIPAGDSRIGRTKAPEDVFPP